MKTFEYLQYLINLFIKREILENERFTPQSLYEPIKYSLNSEGKRVRPIFLLMGANLFTDNVTDVLPPALGIELFHNFTLLHDDIMDNSDMRHNRLTVHKKWGTNTAILCGDAMAFLAQQYIMEVPRSVFYDIVTIYNHTALQICKGQQYDMDFERRIDVTIAEYLEMIHLKTSALIAASAQIGALAGGGYLYDSKRLYEFALDIGFAFQLQDDYLDTFGTESEFGKPIGKDIIANKKTFLLIKALELAQGETAKMLRQLITQKTEDNTKKIELVKQIYTDLKVDVLSQQKMEEYYHSAFKKFELVRAENERKEVMAQFVDRLMKRVK